MTKIALWENNKYKMGKILWFLSTVLFAKCAQKQKTLPVQIIY